MQKLTLNVLKKKFDLEINWIVFTFYKVSIWEIKEMLETVNSLQNLDSLNQIGAIIDFILSYLQSNNKDQLMNILNNLDPSWLSQLTEVFMKNLASIQSDDDKLTDTENTTL